MEPRNRVRCLQNEPRIRTTNKYSRVSFKRECNHSIWRNRHLIILFVILRFPREMRIKDFRESERSLRCPRFSILERFVNYYIVQFCSDLLLEGLLGTYEEVGLDMSVAEIGYEDFFDRHCCSSRH